MVYMETSRLILRNYKITDFTAVRDYFANDEVSRYEDFYPMSDEQIRKIIFEWKTMDNRLVAELKEKQTVIGSIGYWIDEMGHHCIDYDFNPKYYGKGYATEAGKALVYHLFDTTKISAIYADCDVRNEASWRLLERLGFRRIRELHNQSYKNDEAENPILISTFLYELRRSDLGEVKK